MRAFRIALLILLPLSEAALVYPRFPKPGNAGGWVLF